MSRAYCSLLAVLHLLLLLLLLLLFGTLISAPLPSSSHRCRWSDRAEQRQRARGMLERLAGRRFVMAVRPALNSTYR